MTLNVKGESFFQKKECWTNTFQNWQIIVMVFAYSSSRSQMRIKDTTGGRLDVILTSDWKPSHCLFPIKRLYQARDYKRENVRDEGRDTGGVGDKLRDWVGGKIGIERAERVWENEENS